MLEGVGEAFQWLINGGDRRGTDPPEGNERSDLSLQRTLSSYASDVFSEDDTRPLPEVFVYDDDESKYSQSQSYELDACMGNAGSLLYDRVARSGNNHAWPKNTVTQWRLLHHLYQQHQRCEPEGVSPRKKLLLQSANNGGVDAEGSQAEQVVKPQTPGSPHERGETSFDGEVLKMALKILAENQALKHNTNIQRLLEDSDSSPNEDPSPRKRSAAPPTLTANVTSPKLPTNSAPPPATSEPESSDNSIIQTLQRALKIQTSGRPAPPTSCFDSTLFAALDASLDTSPVAQPAPANAKASPPQSRQQHLSASKPLSVTSSQATVVPSTSSPPEVDPESSVPILESHPQSKKFRRRPDSSPPRKRRGRRRLNLVRSHDEAGGAASDDSNSLLPHPTSAYAGVWKKKQRVQSPPTSPAHTTATQPASNVSSGHRHHHHHEVPRPIFLGCTGVERLMQRQREDGAWTRHDFPSEPYLSEYSSGSTKPEHMKIDCATLFPLNPKPKITEASRPIPSTTAKLTASRPGSNDRNSRRHLVSSDIDKRSALNRDKATSDPTCLNTVSWEPDLSSTLPNQSLRLTPPSQNPSRRSSRVASLLDDSSGAVSLSDATGPRERPRTREPFLVVPSFDVSPAHRATTAVITPETYRGLPQLKPKPAVDYWLLNQLASRPNPRPTPFPPHGQCQPVPFAASAVHLSRQRRACRPPKPEKRKSRDCNPVTQHLVAPGSPGIPSPVKSEDKYVPGECDVLSALSGECGNPGALDRMESEPNLRYVPDLIVIDNDDANNSATRLDEPMIPGGRKNPIVIADEVIARSPTRNRARIVSTSHLTGDNSAHRSTQRIHDNYGALTASTVTPIAQGLKFYDHRCYRESSKVPRTQLFKSPCTQGTYSTPIPCRSSDALEATKETTSDHELENVVQSDPASLLHSRRVEAPWSAMHPSRIPLSPLSSQSVRQSFQSPSNSPKSNSGRGYEEEGYLDIVQSTLHTKETSLPQLLESTIGRVDDEIGHQLGVTPTNGVLIFKPTISIYQGPPFGEGRDRNCTREEIDSRNDASQEKSTRSGFSEESYRSVRRAQDTTSQFESGVTSSPIRQDLRQVSLSIARLEQKALEVDAVLSKALDLSAKVEQKLAGAYLTDDDDDGMKEELDRLAQSESSLREELKVIQLKANGSKTCSSECRPDVEPTKASHVKHVSWSNKNAMLIDLTSVDDDNMTTEPCWEAPGNTFQQAQEAHQTQFAMEANKRLNVSYPSQPSSTSLPQVHRQRSLGHLRRELGSTEHFPVDLTDAHDYQESRSSSESAYHSSESSSSGVLSLGTREALLGRSEYLYDSPALGKRLRKADDTTYSRVSSILDMVNDPYPGAWMDQRHQSAEQSTESSMVGVGDSNVLVLHHRNHDDVEVMIVAEEDAQDDDDREEIEVIFVEESFLSTDSFSFGETKGVYFDWKKNLGNESGNPEQTRYHEEIAGPHVGLVPRSSCPSVDQGSGGESAHRNPGTTHEHRQPKCSASRVPIMGVSNRNVFDFAIHNDTRGRAEIPNLKNSGQSNRQILAVDCDPLVDTVIKIPTPRNPGPSRTSSDPPGCHNQFTARKNTCQKSPDGRYLDSACILEAEIESVQSDTMSDVFSGIEDSVVDDATDDQSSIHFKRRIAAIMRRLDNSSDVMTNIDQSDQAQKSHATLSGSAASSTMMEDDNESLLSLSLSQRSAEQSVNSKTTLTSVMSVDAESKLKHLLSRGKSLLAKESATLPREQGTRNPKWVLCTQPSSDLSEWNSSQTMTDNGSSLLAVKPQDKFFGEVRHMTIPSPACRLSGKPPLAASSPASRRLCRLRRLQDRLTISSAGLVKSKRDTPKSQPGRFLSARKRFSPVSRSSENSKEPDVQTATLHQKSALKHTAAARMSQMVAKAVSPRRGNDGMTYLSSKVESPRTTVEKSENRSSGRRRISEELSKAVRIIGPKSRNAVSSSKLAEERRDPPTSPSKHFQTMRGYVSKMNNASASKEPAAPQFDSNCEHHFHEMPDFPDLLHPSLRPGAPSARKDKNTHSPFVLKKSLPLHARTRTATSAFPGSLLWEATREPSAEETSF